MMASVFYAVIEEATGRCLRTGRCLGDAVALQAGPGERSIETDGTVADDLHYWRDGWIAYPSRPDAADGFDYATGAWIVPPAAELARRDAIATAEAAIANAQAYLDATDWLVVRMAETGQLMPDDVPPARAEARAVISEMRARIADLATVEGGVQ